MSATYYHINLTRDTDNVIHDGLWELVKAGSITHDIPSKFFTGLGTEGNKLEVKLSHTFIRGKKSYTSKEFVEEFDLFSRRRMKFQRRIVLTAQLKIQDWIHNRTLDSTKLTAVFYVDHNTLTEAVMGERFFSWSGADNEIELEHPIDVPESDIRVCAALIYRMGKELVDTNKAEQDKMMAIFAKVKI